MRIAVRPLKVVSNSFVEQFANALAGPGFEVVDYHESLSSLKGCDVAFLHWPSEFLSDEGRRRSLHSLARLALARAHGVKFVWVAHNITPHDTESAHPLFVKAFFRLLNGIVYLSQSSRELARANYPVGDHTIECVTVHGRYLPAAPVVAFARPAPSEAVRLASYGHIRRYKNFEGLAEIVSGLGDIELSIFGMPGNAELVREIEAIAAGCTNIAVEFPSQPFSDAELERRIDRCHGVVLPYRNILNSGAALHALSRSRPFLGPAMGSLPELREAVGEDWACLYDGNLNAAHVTAFADELRRPRAAHPDLSAYEWSRVGADLKEFLDRLCGNSA